MNNVISFTFGRTNWAMPDLRRAVNEHAASKDVCSFLAPVIHYIQEEPSRIMPADVDALFDMLLMRYAVEVYDDNRDVIGKNRQMALDGIVAAGRTRGSLINENHILKLVYAADFDIPFAVNYYCNLVKLVDVLAHYAPLAFDEKVMDALEKFVERNPNHQYKIEAISDKLSKRHLTQAITQKWLIKP